MKRTSPKFSKKVLAQADKIRSGESFRSTQDALLKAISMKDAKAEKFWRDVFGAYAEILQRIGTDGDTWNLASCYAYDGLVPEPNPNPAPKRRPKVGASDLDEDVPF